MNHKTVCGVGMTCGIKTRDIDGSILKSYTVWQNMLVRCYDSKFITKQPYYQGCSVHDDWLYYPKFKIWFDHYYQPGHQLDKDILFPGNKLYSHDTCCLVPKEINSLVKSSNKSRGKYPIGVTYDKHRNKYTAHINKNGRSNYLGSFDSINEAFNLYKSARESYIKEKASQYFCEGKITWAVRTALHNIIINITD